MNAIINTSANKERQARIDSLMRGAIDLHCHSGPSVMPLYCDHVEASEAGLKAVLLKDRYYSCTPVTTLLNKHFSELDVHMLWGRAPEQCGRRAQRSCRRAGFEAGCEAGLDANVLSANHIAHHHQDEKFTEKFPQTTQRMPQPIPLTVLDENGRLKEEVKAIFDLIAAEDVVLSAGHLNIKEVWPLFEEARKRGVKRLLVSHPTNVVDATLDNMCHWLRKTSTWSTPCACG